MQLTREKIQETIKQKTDYLWFDKGNYNLNIVGVRNSDTKNEVTNRSDDKITLSYKVDGKWQFHCFDCTTDPGTHWVENIMRKEGVAILKPGQYRGSHIIRKHQGRYEALGQNGPVTVYRDANKDDKYDLDPNNTQTGLFGIYIHRATKWGGKK